MKVLTIVGARPQFIKAATVSREIGTRADMSEVIVHTGQHYDVNMSEIFFTQLDIPVPQHNLNVSGLAHGAMTGRMLEGIEELINQEKPDWVLVYGDTNSTLAGALAATKLGVPLAHVEAGLRSHNPAMPEEINRVLTDRVSSCLLCPTDAAVENLRREGFPFMANFNSHAVGKQRVVKVGDVMYDAALYYRERVKNEIDVEFYGVRHKQYALCTLHRQENTDNQDRLLSILAALQEVAQDRPVLIPLHPRTRSKIGHVFEGTRLENLIVIDPLPYLEMQGLQMSASLILTDSGGMQKEAYFHRVPCITLRDETEWMETVTSGWNQIVGADSRRILEAVRQAEAPVCDSGNIYGEGDAARKVVDALEDIK